MTDPVDRAREAAHLLTTETATLALAGALGGIVRWITRGDSIMAGVAGIILGAICALYLGPLVEPILRPVFGQIGPHADARGFAGFIVGLAGISLPGLIIDIFARKRTGGGSDDKA